MTAIWMGDLESSFMNTIEDCVVFDPTSILFAPHHGRESGKPPQSWLEAMNPKIIVVGEADSDDLCYYSGYTHICQNRAGDIVFDFDAEFIDIYVSNLYQINGLKNRYLVDRFGLHYLGSIPVA